MGVRSSETTQDMGVFTQGRLGGVDLNVWFYWNEQGAVRIPARLRLKAEKPIEDQRQKEFNFRFLTFFS